MSTIEEIQEGMDVLGTLIDENLKQMGLGLLVKRMDEKNYKVGQRVKVMNAVLKKQEEMLRRRAEEDSE